MSSNLPPGCDSADGGIDHALEGALDNLCDIVRTPECAVLLKRLGDVVLPAVRHASNASYDEGRADREHEIAVLKDRIRELERVIEDARRFFHRANDYQTAADGMSKILRKADLLRPSDLVTAK